MRARSDDQYLLTQVFRLQGIGIHYIRQINSITYRFYSHFILSIFFFLFCFYCGFSFKFLFANFLLLDPSFLFAFAFRLYIIIISFPRLSHLYLYFFLSIILNRSLFPQILLILSYFFLLFYKLDLFIYLHSFFLSIFIRILIPYFLVLFIYYDSILRIIFYPITNCVA